MKCMVWVCLLSSVFVGSCLGWGDGCLKKYGSLISEVHKRHATSGVFFIFSRNSRHFQDYIMIHSLIRDFSQQGIRTVVFNLEELSDRAKFYSKRTVQPLMVVLLRTMDDVTEFQKETRYIHTKYAVWLMIYFGEIGEPLCEYCADPTGNLLYLRIDTEMIVVCCDNRTIKEWWSARKNQTETADYATWKENEGFHAVASSAVYDRRKDVNGVEPRITLVSGSSVDRNVRQLRDSYFGAVLIELSRAMNFTIKTVSSLQSFGSYNPITRNWSGVVGELAERRADIGVAEFTITSSRLSVIDFTMPLLLARNHLYIKQPDGSGAQWSAYFQAFTWQIWVSIILLLITSSVLLTVINPKKSKVKIIYLFLENYLNVWGLFCQQGLFEFPAETPLRIAFFSIMVSAVVVLTAYSASLTSFITVKVAALPFDTVTGFVNDGSYKLIVIPKSSNWDLFSTSSNQNFKKMMKLMKPSKDLPISFDDGFRQVCKERVAFYTNELVRRVMNDRIKCKIVSIETEQLDSLAMALAPDSQYNVIVNYHLQRFHENGVLNRLKRQFLGTEDFEEASHDAVSLSGVVPILSVLSGGTILAVILLLFEKMYFRRHKNVPSSEDTKFSQNSKIDRCYNVCGGEQKAIASKSMINLLEERRMETETFLFVN